jgi:hypothetical protein
LRRCDNEHGFSIMIQGRVSNAHETENPAARGQIGQVALQKGSIILCPRARPASRGPRCLLLLRVGGWVACVPRLVRVPMPCHAHVRGGERGGQHDVFFLPRNVGWEDGRTLKRGDGRENLIEMSAHVRPVGGGRERHSARTSATYGQARFAKKRRSIPPDHGPTKGSIPSLLDYCFVLGDAPKSRAAPFLARRRNKQPTPQSLRRVVARLARG